MSDAAAQTSWIEGLRAECRRSSQAEVARRMNYSGAVISTVLKGVYRGNLTAVEMAYRGAFQARTVDCPVVGTLSTQACAEHQRQPWAPHNPQRIQFYRACRSGCPHARILKSGGY